MSERERTRVIFCQEEKASLTKVTRPRKMGTCDLRGNGSPFFGLEVVQVGGNFLNKLSQPSQSKKLHESQCISLPQPVDAPIDLPPNLTSRPPTTRKSFHNLLMSVLVSRLDRNPTMFSLQIPVGIVPE